MSTPSAIEQTYERIRSILSEARAGVYRAINAAMVAAYWEIGRVIVEQEQQAADYLLGLAGDRGEIGRVIVEQEQQGQQRTGYGQTLIAELSSRLKSEFGKGFDPSNLAMMRAFYLAYPILDAVRPELSWTHYCLLLRVEKPDARAFYEVETVNSGWSAYTMK